MIKQKKRRTFLRSLVAIFLALLYLVPIYVVVTVAVKPPTDTSSYWRFPTSIHWENFKNAATQGGILTALKNTIIITFFSVALIAVVGAFAAYPLARHRSRITKAIHTFVLGVMMVPPLSILVPLYSTMVDMNAVNTYWGIILVLVTFELPLSIFLYSNFISAIPTALDEAAAIDGCGPARTFFQIILPQLAPVTASVIILTGVHCWNDYQFSLYILQGNRYKTVPLAIASFFSQTTSDVHAATAAALIAILPIIIVYLLLQKQFVQSMVDSAVK